MKEIYADNDKKLAFHRFKDNHKARFMLRFDLADGSHKSIVYRLMADLNLAGDSLTINFIHTTIKITGQNLTPIFMAINDKIAGKIIEQHSISENQQKIEPFISKIEMLER